MRPLIIGAEQEREIAAAIKRALTHVIPLSVIEKYRVEADHHLKLKDRPKDFDRSEIGHSENVIIPMGYRAAISFEEQPAGLCRHLSISVDKPGALPSVEAAKFIASAFGFRSDFTAARVWIEEFEPGHSAVNVLEPINIAEAGNA